MTQLQKVIKYLALAFAIYLSVTIISAIIFGLSILFGITTGFSGTNNSEQSIIELQSQEFSGIQKLEIKLNVCKLTVKKGDRLKVDASNVTDKFKCDVKGNVLEIEDRGISGLDWFNFNNVLPEITLYVPEGYEFENIDIKSGINETSIEYLNSKKIDIEAGVGKCIIEDLNSEEANIKGGAGEIIVDNSKTEDLRVKSGVGRTVITSEIKNIGRIESGVGSLELNLAGDKDTYRVKGKTGLGNFVVDGQKMNDNQVIGNGKIDIEIKAGVGETRVNFK